ncbi:MAG: histidine phosphatase family protein [Defluviitaleaceae bacterium]|nr:histidine phosphatase family protein [Defluviitaleaceae bacterium]
MKIFTVRHGQTHWNTEGRIQGHMDIPLDETGLAQAERLGARLANEKVDIIYASDLLRAAKTAEIINRHHNAEFVTAPALRETSFGIYEGQIYHDVHYDIQHHHALNQPLPGGESVFDYFARIYAFLDEITAKRHQNIIIVGHFGTVRAAICYFLQIPIENRERFHIGNTAVHCFERGDDGRFRMTLENDISHL